MRLIFAQKVKRFRSRAIALYIITVSARAWTLPAWLLTAKMRRYRGSATKFRHSTGQDQKFKRGKMWKLIFLSKSKRLCLRGRGEIICNNYYNFFIRILSSWLQKLYCTYQIQESFQQNQETFFLVPAEAPNFQNSSWGLPRAKL